MGFKNLFYIIKKAVLDSCFTDNTQVMNIIIEAPFFSVEINLLYSGSEKLLKVNILSCST